MPNVTPKPPAKPTPKSSKPSQPKIISKQVFTDFASL